MTCKRLFGRDTYCEFDMTQAAAKFALATLFEHRLRRSETHSSEKYAVREGGCEFANERFKGIGECYLRFI
jgi:hypothetical protein